MTPQVSTPSAPPRDETTTDSAPTTRHRLLRSPRLLTLLVGGLVAVAAGLVELAFRMAPYPSDQLNYFDAAWAFPSHPTYAGLHQFLRHGLILPIRLAQELFGYSQAAYLLVPMLAGIALAVGVYVLGALLFNRTVGVIAAVLTIANSLVFPDLTQPLPDLPATALMCWAIVLSLAIQQRRRLVTATSRRLVVTLVLVGVLMGWSYLTREYIVFLWPLVPLLLFRRVAPLRLLWVVAPLAAVGVLELVVNGLVFGDALARLHASASHGDGAPATGDFIGRSSRWYLTRLNAIVAATPEALWLKASLIATIAGALFSRRLAFLLGWAAMFYVPLVALGGLLDPSGPMLRILKERYWLPLVPALLLSAVAGLWLLARHRAQAVPSLRARAGLVAGVVTAALVAMPVAVAHTARVGERTNITMSYAANDGTHLEEFRTWLGQHANAVPTIWADQRSIRLVKIFVNGTFGTPVWTGELEIWSPNPGKPDPAPGDYVVLYSARSRLCTQCQVQAEALLGPGVRVPATWVPAFTSENRAVEVYRVR